MKINSKDFRAQEGENLKKWPTLVKPVYKSKKKYSKHVGKHQIEHNEDWVVPPREIQCLTTVVIDFFRNKTSVSPARLRSLSDAARAKAFTVSAGASRQVRVRHLFGSLMYKRRKRRQKCAKMAVAECGNRLEPLSFEVKCHKRGCLAVVFHYEDRVGIFRSRLLDAASINGRSTSGKCNY